MNNMYPCPFSRFQMDAKELDFFRQLCKMGIEYFSKRIYTVEFGASPLDAERCRLLARFLAWSEEE